MVRTSFATLWEEIGAALPDRVAVRADGRSVTFRELEEAASRLAGALRAAGVGAGAKIASYLYNGIPYLECVYAALKLGAVPVNVNHRYRRSELAQILADADAEALVFDAALADCVAGAELPRGLLLVQVQGDVPASLLPGAVGFEAAKAAHDPLPRSPRGGDDELFVYTGGTTGLPKGVVWRQGDLLESMSFALYREFGRTPPEDVAGAVAIACELVDCGEAPTTLPVAPLMHGTALFAAMGTLTNGGTVVFASGRSLDPRAVWATVERERVTRIVIAGNAMARPLVEELERAERASRPYSIGSLDAIVSSGVAWTDDVKRALLERQPMVLLDVLASSEGGPYALALTRDVSELPARFFPTPGAKVLDELGEEVEPGSETVGVIAYSGAMPRGYYKDPAKTAATFREVNGVRHVIPGDLARVAADGSIVFLGRGAGVINSGGEKIYPAEVEGVLLEHPAVVDCAVFGLPDARWGEVATALVQAAVARGAAPEELAAYVGERLAGYKKPRRVVLVDALPRGPNGKLDLAAARALASERLAALGAA